MEEDKIETPTTLQDENEIPSSFKKADWLSAKMIKSPFQSILLGLLLIISTLSTVTIYQYNSRENERIEYIDKTETKWLRLSEKQEKEVVEYKNLWIECMVGQVKELEHRDSVTSGKTYRYKSKKHKK